MRREMVRPNDLFEPWKKRIVAANKADERFLKYPFPEEREFHRPLRAIQNLALDGLDKPLFIDCRIAAGIEQGSVQPRLCVMAVAAQFGDGRPDAANIGKPRETPVSFRHPGYVHICPVPLAPNPPRRIDSFFIAASDLAILTGRTQLDKAIQDTLRAFP